MLPVDPGIATWLADIPTNVTLPVCEERTWLAVGCGRGKDFDGNGLGEWMSDYESRRHRPRRCTRRITSCVKESLSL